MKVPFLRSTFCSANTPCSGSLLRDIIFCTALSTREVIAERKVVVVGVCTSGEVGCFTSSGEFDGIGNPEKFPNSHPSLGPIKLVKCKGDLN